MLNRRSPFYIRPRPSWELLTWLGLLLRRSSDGHVKRSAPLLRDLQFASRACYEEIADTSANDFGFVKKGLLALCRTDAMLEDQTRLAAYANQLGITAEVVTPSRTSELEPNIRMSIKGAVYYPQDCHLSPELLMASLARSLEQAGVQFNWATEVRGWQLKNGKVGAVSTTGGDYTADEYVVCGGSWSAAILRSLGVRLPLQAGKGYSLTLTHPPQLPQLSFLLCEARVAATPMGGRLRFGGTLEISPRDLRINNLRVQTIIDRVQQYFPELSPRDFDGVKPWCGLRPCTPDGLPYAGRLKRYENVWVAAGHAMFGISLAPITGKLMAEMLSGKETSIPIDALSPNR